MLSQRWEHILFLHYSYDKESIQKHLPKGLVCDTYGDQAYLSIVPFSMNNIKFGALPTLPFTSLWELNLRTYVKHNGESGIYFFTLDSTHRLGNWIARKFFHLPYRHTSIQAHVTKDKYSVKSPKFSVEAQIQSSASSSSDLDKWLTERYCLYTESPKGILKGQVSHKPWSLNPASITSYENSFSDSLGFPMTKTRNKDLEENFAGATYSKRLDVRFKPFRKV